MSNIDNKILKIELKSREKKCTIFPYCQSQSVRICKRTYKGAFNNYVDQILPNFDPHPLEWTEMDILHTLYPLSRDPCRFSTDPHPALLVKVVIECPLTS